MKHFLGFVAIAVLFTGTFNVAYAHCGKCGENKAQIAVSAPELVKQGGCCKDGNTTASSEKNSEKKLVIKQKSSPR